MYLLIPVATSALYFLSITFAYCGVLESVEKLRGMRASFDVDFNGMICCVKCVKIHLFIMAEARMFWSACVFSSSYCCLELSAVWHSNGGKLDPWLRTVMSFFDKSEFCLNMALQYETRFEGFPCYRIGQIVTLAYISCSSQFVSGTEINNFSSECQRLIKT